MNRKTLLPLPLLFAGLCLSSSHLAADPAEKTVAQFNLDEGIGTQLTDAANPNQKANLTDVEWIKPGFKDSAAAVRFSGQSSRLDLPAKSTPNGPFSLRIAVRPKAYDGLFFADVGGMTLGTKADGKPFFMRINSDGKWAYVAGSTAIPLDKWTLIEARWDGGKIQISVDGAVASEAPCGAQFSSARCALGYNPFAAGSQYFRGDLDAMEIRVPG